MMFDTIAPPGIREDILALVSIGLAFVAIGVFFSRVLRFEDDEWRATVCGLLALGASTLCMLLSLAPARRHSHGPGFAPLLLMLGVGLYVPTSLLHHGLNLLRIVPLLSLWMTLLTLASGNSDSSDTYWPVAWMVPLGYWGALITPPVLGAASLLAEWRREAEQNAYERSPR